MVRWYQPLEVYIFGGYGGCILLRFVLFIDEILEQGLMVLVYAVILVLAITLVFYYLVKRILGDLYDHELSYWNMEADQVVGRLDAAMKARGVHVVVERKRKRVWFPLQPLSVVVAPGYWRRTTIYVGPSTDETELLVERLEGFVERALV